MTRVAQKGYAYEPDKNKSRPYKVQISVSGKKKYIGNYATPAEAIAVYREAREQYPMLPPKGGGKQKFGRHYSKERCKFCGEERTSHQMNRHLLTCKWKEVERDPV